MCVKLVNTNKEMHGYIGGEKNRETTLGSNQQQHVHFLCYKLDLVYLQCCAIHNKSLYHGCR